MVKDNDQNPIQDLIEESFNQVLKNIDDLCEFVEGNTHFTHHTTKNYLALRNGLIEDVKALEFYYKGTVNK